MLVQSLVRPLTGRVYGSGGGGGSNTVSFNSYADRTMETDEVLWTHAVPQDCTIPMLAVGSTAYIEGGVGATITVTLNEVTIGTILFGSGSTEGVFNFTEDVSLVEDDVIKIIATTTVGGANLSISLLGAVL
ncbi:hypothetical protein HOU79_gp73 [Vibrio phage 1.224.A._10N.261.48.B1]|uniref:Uncharacterized protein n=1 Tax=Vibrio phage 1.224.A._10N.261.48.B1 TaxID=1881226 RepID=A0A2I7RRV8_9CAUD|nr:hypothetical protein HOU79_gp73 [Vibrio phage 1.224.A._10N.261.48.B1]AUR96400.1 hypothetical protein NVP1224A_33 [Vibrio phage 1.224.A._10N.261.48.B1]